MPMRTMDEILGAAIQRPIGKEGMPADVIAAVIYVQAAERIWDRIESLMMQELMLREREYRKSK